MKRRTLKDRYRTARAMQYTFMGAFGIMFMFAIYSQFKYAELKQVQPIEVEVCSQDSLVRLIEHKDSIIQQSNNYAKRMRVNWLECKLNCF